MVCSACVACLARDARVARWCTHKTLRCSRPSEKEATVWVHHPRLRIKIMTTLTETVARAVGVALLVSVLPHAANAQPSSIPVAQEFDKLHFRSIGPATMSGRIADVAVYENNPAIFYVGTAHGGVWKTTSNGNTFTPLFQDQGLMAIGDVEVSQANPDVVWVGTGESNNRQSTSWGSGLYKSTDGGKTFVLMGLPQSKHINRIVIHPTNPDIVLVAATGPLFGPGGERGIYRTADGGKSWTKTLSVDDETGANDVAISRSEPNVVFASTYQRRRTACCMNGGGPGSALWKSTDGGVTFKKIVGNGFPGGSLGRIAVDVFRAGSNIVYAAVEAPTPGRAAAVEEGAEAPAGPPGAAGGATGVYRSDDGGTTWKKASSTNPRPMYFSQLRIDPVNADKVFMGGVGLHMSINGGVNFETDAALVLHDDVHAIWIDPRNTDHILIGEDGGLGVSYDQARTWQMFPNLPVGLFYHVSFDMSTPYKVCGGMQDNYDWCGPSASRMNRGIFNYDWFQIQGGDGFVAIPDLRDPRIVYSESQDGNMTRKNIVTGESKSIRPTTLNVTNATAGESYRFHWDTPLMLSPGNPGILLTSANRVFRSRNRGDSWEAISPDLTKNENRANIVTMGLKGSDISISRDDGISQWPAIVSLGESQKKPGLFYTGTDDGTVSMSADDGKSWQNITSRLPGFPSGHAFVSEVVPSRFDANVAYIAVNNYRQNDYDPYLWMTSDNGATFKSLASGLRGEVVRTLTEDTRNPDVLYVGTETGIFLSIDRGTSWRRLKANFPNVRVDELTIHPRDNALLVATHGRALWILDHLEPIQEYAAAMKADAALFTPGSAMQWKSKDDRNDEFWGHQFFTGENPPTDAVLQFYLGKPATKPVIRISTPTGKLIRELAIPDTKNVAGVQTVCWDQRVEPIRATGAAIPPGAGGRGGAGGGGGGGGRGGARPIPGIPEALPTIGYLPENPCGAAAGGGGGGGGGGFGGGAGGGTAGPYVLPGAYSVALVIDGKPMQAKTLNIVMDPEVPLVGPARVAYNALVLDLHEAQGRGTETAAKLTALNTELARVAGQVDSSGATAAMKTQFTTLRSQLDSVRAKFGLTLAAGGGGRGGAGGGRGGAAGAPAGAAAGAPATPTAAFAAQVQANAQANALGRVGTAKNAIQNVWETPSAALVKQATDAKLALSAAVLEANAVLARARTLAPQLERQNVKITVPPAGH